MTDRRRLGILGAGAFGASLALVYSSKFNTTLFSGFKDHVDSMTTSRINEFFPNFKIPNYINIKTTSDLRKGEFDCFLWAFPVKPTPDILKNLSKIMDNVAVVICSKGLLADGSFTYNLFKNLLPNSKVGYLAGPNFADDLAKYTFSSADIIFEDIDDAGAFANELSVESFKLFPSDDMIGAQICGAVKNIAAIACGMIMGIMPSNNTRAAFLSFALREMKNLGIRLGGKEDTFYGLCGLGDLVLTTFNEASRNFSLGARIAKGEPIDSIVENSKATCEGYDTVSQIISLAKFHNVEMPICEKVYEILFGGAKPNSILEVLK
ncbi:MAG: NAD(P)H-dependent glycerol-3-phosphate dehydrogenase [Holosporales bacterium]|jgi:glycerol-3-phosphate dehydrogenase|nr:NAD(P)H-dependent glycerol-3-phosphate dehydrogenase [Holosporales bacterium]